MKALKYLVAIVMLVALTTSAVAQSSPIGKPVNPAEVTALRKQFKELTTSRELISQCLAKFDKLDYTIISDQQWSIYSASW